MPNSRRSQTKWGRTFASEGETDIHLIKNDWPQACVLCPNCTPVVVSCIMCTVPTIQPHRKALWEKNTWGYLVHGVWNHCLQFCGTMTKTSPCIHLAIFASMTIGLRTRVQEELIVILHSDATACPGSHNDR